MYTLPYTPILAALLNIDVLPEHLVRYFPFHPPIIASRRLRRRRKRLHHFSPPPLVPRL